MTRDEAIRAKMVAEAELGIARHELHMVQSEGRRTRQYVNPAVYDKYFDNVRAKEGAVLRANLELAKSPKGPSIERCFYDVAFKLLDPVVFERIRSVAMTQHAAEWAKIRAANSPV